MMQAKIQTKIQTEQLVKDNQKIYDSIPPIQVSNICKFGDLSKFFPSNNLNHQSISPNRFIRVIYTVGSGVNPNPNVDYFTLLASGYYRRLICIPSKPLVSYDTGLLKEICNMFYSTDINFINNVIVAWKKTNSHDFEDYKKVGKDLLSMLDTPESDENIIFSNVLYYQNIDVNNDNFFIPLYVEFQPGDDGYLNF